jgi:hypothetical protein
MTKKILRGDKYENKFRRNILTIALAAKGGKDRDLRKATEIMLKSIFDAIEDAFVAGHKQGCKDGG